MLYHKTEIFLFNLVARTRISLRKRTIFVWTFSVINFGSRRREGGEERDERETEAKRGRTHKTDDRTVQGEEPQRAPVQRSTLAHSH